MATDAMICTDLHGLTPEQNRAIAIKLKRNCPWSKVAAEMDIAESTIYRWRIANPEIDQFLDRVERDNVIAAREKLSASLEDAVDALAKICKDPAVEARDRIAAASKMLDIASKGKSEQASPSAPRDGADRERDGPARQPARARVSANVIDVDAELEAELSTR